MALAVLITGIDGFGGELWKTDAFWWDAKILRDMFGDRLQPDDPWPAWSVRIRSVEMLALMRDFPVRFAHHQHHYDELKRSVEAAQEVGLKVYEWSSE